MRKRFYAKVISFSNYTTTRASLRVKRTKMFEAKTEIHGQDDDDDNDDDKLLNLLRVFLK